MSQPDFSQFDLIPQISQSTLNKLNAVSHAISEQRVRENQASDSTNFLAELQRSNLASEFAQQLLSRINQFDAELDAGHEVGVRLVSFGQAITFHVSDVGYYTLA